MTNKVYKISPFKLYVYLLWPLCCFVFLSWAFVNGWDKANYSTSVKLVFATIILLIFSVPYTILTLNYWKHSRKKELIVSDETFIYKDGGGEIEFLLKDIQSISEYYSVSRIYGTFCYYKIALPNRELTFPNMLISKNNLKKHFGNQINRKIIAWPILT